MARLILRQGLVLLLSTLFASQFVVARPNVPIQRTDERTAKSNEELDPSPRTHLLLGAVVVFTENARHNLKEFRSYIGDTMKELNALPTKSAALAANITEMSRVLRAIEDVNVDVDDPSLEDMYDAIEKVYKMLDDFDGMPESDDPNSDVVILEKAFDRAGSVEVDKRITQVWNASLRTFEELFAAYSKKLSDADRVKDAKLLDWYEQYKKGKDVEAKLKMFEEFWKFYQ